MRTRRLPDLKPRQLGEVQVVLGFTGFLGGMYGLSVAWIALADPHGIRELVDVALVLGSIVVLCGSTFAGLLLGKRWGWVLGILLYGLLLLTCAFGFVIALLAGAKDDAPSFAESSSALFGCMILALVAGTPLYLLLRCRKRYFQITSGGPARR